MNRDFDQVPFSRRSFFALAVLPIALGSAPAFAAADAESFVSSVGNGVLAAARSNSVGQFRSILNSSADVRTIAIYSLGPYRKNLTKDLERQYVALVEDYISKVFASHSLHDCRMRVADEVRVPAGAALAVDREKFSESITGEISRHPLIHVERREIPRLPTPAEMSPLIVATGPLTSSGLSADIAAFVGRDHLAFFDAISPIVLAETIDMSKVFRASRWDRSLRPRGSCPSDPSEMTPEVLPGDYLNCPFNEDEYRAFHAAVVSAEKAAVHDFDNTKFFEGCLPLEVMAQRGVETLRFGPMKPAGLRDPRTGKRPYAVAQLRQDNLAGDHYSLVGFQTQMKWGEQARVLRMIPGLEQAEFVRLGMIHRNTYINGPSVLTETWQTRTRPDLFFAGQVSGVEGYVESAASGLIAGRNAARVVLGQSPIAPPRETAIGALGYYVSHADPKHYEPSNITFGIMPPLDAPPKSRQERQLATSDRALAALTVWARSAENVFAAELHA